MSEIFKKYVLPIVVATAIILGICAFIQYNHHAENDNFPAYINLMKERNNAEVALGNSNIHNTVAFLNETKLIAYTVNKRIHYRIDFVYYDYDQEKAFALPSITRYEQHMNDNEWREYIRVQLTNTILDYLNSPNNIVSDNGDIIGVTLYWYTTDINGNKEADYYICDEDGDGTWDYGYRSALSRDIITLENLTGEERLRDFQKLLG